MSRIYFACARPAVEVVCEEIQKFPVHPDYEGHKRDALKNIALWKKEMREEYLHLFILSYLRTLKAIPKYWLVVINRKGTIALTRGYVNGSYEDFDELRAGQFELSLEERYGVVEISGAVANLEVWSAGEIHQCMVTLDTGVTAYTTSAPAQVLLATAYARREPVTMVTEGAPGRRGGYGPGVATAPKRGGRKGAS